MSQVSHSQFLPYTSAPTFVGSLPSSCSSVALADLPFWIRNVKAKSLLLPQSILIIQIKCRKVTQMLWYLIDNGIFYTHFSASQKLSRVVWCLFSFHFLYFTFHSYRRQGSFLGISPKHRIVALLLIYVTGKMKYFPLSQKAQLGNTRGEEKLREKAKHLPPGLKVSSVIQIREGHPIC